MFQVLQTLTTKVHSADYRLLEAFQLNQIKLDVPRKSDDANE